VQSPEGQNALKSGEKKTEQQLDINRGVDEGERHFTTRFSLTVVYLSVRGKTGGLPGYTRGLELSINIISPSTFRPPALLLVKQTRGKLISLTDRRLAAWRAEGAEKDAINSQTPVSCQRNARPSMAAPEGQGTLDECVKQAN
ncbi:hypothetical protein KUCAC02_001063, partial [Chaenocephalus aceratus]